MSEIVMSAMMILPMVILVQAVMIPVQLKFGAEKGRIAIFGLFGVLVGLGVAAMKVVTMLGGDFSGLTNRISTVSIGEVTTVMMAAAIVLFLVSVKISIGIMNKREF